MISKIHRPPHILKDNAWYFITAHTYANQFILLDADHKELFLHIFEEISSLYQFHVSAWVILDNHYHFMAFIRESRSLAPFMNQLHGRTSFILNKLDMSKGRKVWYNFWDRIIHGKAEYWATFNYIHFNPVKHGYVKEPQSWQYSSYRDYLKKKTSRI